MSSGHFRLTHRATSAALGLSGYVLYFPLFLVLGDKCYLNFCVP
jgi:hypothetical protein